MDHAIADRWLTQVDEALSGPGRRAGAARTAVVELLAREGQCLLSAHEILRRLPNASASSVYRLLDELLELGLVHRFHGDDGVARYEIADPDGHHHHLIDDVTGSPIPFADHGLELAIEAVAARLGVRLTGHEVVIRGKRRSNGTES